MNIYKMRYYIVYLYERFFSELVLGGCMFKNLKLGKKIGGGFFVILTLLSLVVCINILVLNKTNDGIGKYRVLAQDTNLIGHIQSDMLMLRLNVTNYLISQNDENLKEYQEYAAKIAQLIKTAKTQIVDAERVQMIADVENGINSYNIAFQDVIALNAERGKQYKRLALFKKEMQDAIIHMVEIAHENNNAETSYYASDVQKEMFLGLLFVAKFLNTNDVNDYKLAIKNIQDQLKTEITNLDKHLYEANVRDAFIDFKIAHTSYVRYVHKTYEVITKRDAVIQNSLDVLGPDMIKRIEILEQSILQDQETLGPELKDDTDKSISMSITLVIAAIVIGVIAAYLLTKAITQPINRAVSVANRLAQGDLTIQIKATNNDETGTLLRAMQETVNNLKHMLSTISDASIELASASEELSVVTQQTTQGIAQQELETDSVATAMNQMATTVREVADNATSAADAAKMADQTVKSSDRVVNNTLSSVNNLSDSVNDSSIKLSGVEEQVENINSILGEIKGVAEQTNLLALNAAIEAARAGEHGRGFAVVADEVRALASRTHDSTQEIENIIEKLQTGTQDTVTVMNKGKEQADLCVVYAQETQKALVMIKESITTISDMNFQIAGASEEQSQVAENINENVVNVKRIAEENAAGATQTKGSSGEIAQLAEQLKELVTQFKV